MTPRRHLRARQAVINRWRVRRRASLQRANAAAQAYLAKCAMVSETPNATDFLASILDQKLKAMFREVSE